MDRAARSNLPRKSGFAIRLAPRSNSELRVCANQGKRAEARAAVFGCMVSKRLRRPPMRCKKWLMSLTTLKQRY